MGTTPDALEVHQPAQPQKGAVLLTTHYLEEARPCVSAWRTQTGPVVALDRTSVLSPAAKYATMLCFKTDAALPEDLLPQARVTGRIVQLRRLT